MWNFSNSLIGNKVSVFVCSDVRYHKICSGHHTEILSNGQPFKFAASNLAPITHFSKHSKEPQWHNWHSRTDIAEFWSGSHTVSVHYGTIISWSCHNEPIIYFYRAQMGKIVTFVPITSLPVSRALAKLGYLGRIGRNKFERLLIVFGHWTMTAALRLLIFHISKNKYTSLITNSINRRNCSFSHFADSGSKSTSEIWRVAYCFWALNRSRLT